eukprot:gene19383-biopygen17499
MPATAEREPLCVQRGGRPRHSQVWRRSRAEAIYLIPPHLTSPHRTLRSSTSTWLARWGAGIPMPVPPGDAQRCRSPKTPPAGWGGGTHPLRGVARFSGTLWHASPSAKGANSNVKCEISPRISARVQGVGGGPVLTSDLADFRSSQRHPRYPQNVQPAWFYGDKAVKIR